MKHDRPIQGITDRKQERYFEFDNVQKVLCGHLYKLSEFVQEANKSLKDEAQREIFWYVQRLFLTCDEFDKCMVYFIRKLTANFLSNELIKNKKINGLEIHIATIVDADSYEAYIEDVVLRFGRDAQGLLLLVVPVIMKMSVHIVNIDTSQEAQLYVESPKFSLIEGPARHADLMHEIAPNSQNEPSALNLHDQTLYVMRKDGHYDAIFATGAAGADMTSEVKQRVNADYFKPEWSRSDEKFKSVLEQDNYVAPAQAPMNRSAQVV